MNCILLLILKYQSLKKTSKNFQVPHNRRATSTYNIKTTPNSQVVKDTQTRSRPTTIVDIIKDKEIHKGPLSSSTPILLKKPTNLIEQEMIPMPCLRDKTTPSEREKKILDVWDIFKTIYSKVIY